MDDPVSVADRTVESLPRTGWGPCRPVRRASRQTVRMYAVTITQPGDPEVLHWAEVPDPEPGPGEALLEISASAVNRARRQATS